MSWPYVSADEVIDAVRPLVAKSRLNNDMKPSEFSFVGWGGDFKSLGQMPGVYELFFPQRDDTIVRVAIDLGLDSDFAQLGHAYLPRIGGRASMNNLHGPRRFLWDLAFGYVNGFPMKDIAYYLLTRVLRPRPSERNV